jgi:DNA-directed RNA polymerase subunit E'/Rpb7
MNSFVTNQLLTEEIYLDAQNMNYNNLEKMITGKLNTKISGKCYNNGYVIPNTTEFIKKTLGKVVNVDNKNKILYNIKFSVDMLIPSKGDIISCYIDGINKMGIIAYIKMSEIIDGYEGEDNLKNSPLIIMIPADKVHNIEEKNVKQKIKVYIKAVRVKYGTSEIQLVANDVDYLVHNIMKDKEITYEEALKILENS